jgi:PD-(D/E)XK nuclease superfamily protein
MAKIPEPTHSTIESIYRTYEDQPQVERSYLGCSSFGNECDRALWYAFRWARAPEQFSGRMLRLFNTGHREEERLIADLRLAGCEVYIVDPESGQQFAVSGLGGHLRGHLDGVVMGLVEAPKTPHVLECKTHNMKSYVALLKDGVKHSKPGHYAQMQLYMRLEGLDRAFYLAQNKNDDSLYAERVHVDPAAVAMLIRRAEQIITAEAAPPKISDDPEFFACRWCPSKGVCHEGEFARRNCRTCVSATPIVDDSDRGTWYCEHWRRELSLDDQRAGCSEHLFLPSLVPGEQTDADPEKRIIEYQLKDGVIWVDGKGGDAS